MITDLMSAIGSVRTITDMLKTALDAKTFNAVNAVLSEMYGKLIAAQELMFNIQSERDALKKQVVALEKRVDEQQQEITRLGQWVVDRQNYQLKEFAPGAFAYVLKPLTGGVEANAEPVHLLCCQCYESGFKSVLQFAGWDASHRVRVCPRCQQRTLERVESSGATIQTAGRRSRLDGFL